MAIVRIVGTSLALGALLSLAAACSALPWTSHPPRLFSPVNGRVGAGQVGLSAGSKLTEGDIPLCLDQPGTATITNVQPIDTVNGLTVLAFAVRHIPAGSVPKGDAIGDLSAIGMSDHEQQLHDVTNICDAQERANVGLDGAPPPGTPDPRIDLVVTFTAPRLPATAERLKIDYTVDGERGSTEAAFAIAMCAGKIGDPCPTAAG